MRTCIQLVVCIAALTTGTQADEPSWRDRQNAEWAGLPPSRAPKSIDACLDEMFGPDQPALPRCSDALFARRVYFDLVGLPPTEQALERFERDDRPDKRAHLVDTLLSDDVAYAEHWMSFWNDVLRNDEQTSIDGLRKPITAWLFGALRENQPYDVMVATLLNPGDNGPDGYVRGVQWRGTVNASQQPALQAAQSVAQVFLATPVKCASCHNSFVDSWKLEDAYGLASFFSPTNLQMFHCDKESNQVAEPKFLFPEVGGVSPRADLAERRRRIAEIVTSPRNTRFARTIVNRVWHRFFGWSLFTPLDTYDERRIAYPDLLDRLADDFARDGYDLKRLMRTIVLSAAYQSESRPQPTDDRFDARRMGLRGPLVRRLSSEQILDAMAVVTGYWPEGEVMSADVPNDRIRAWRWKVPHTLARALGRPHREQPITKRDDEATVLQALELVNGAVLTDRLTEGAKALLASPLGREPDARRVLDALYRRAVGRTPDQAEFDHLAPSIGTPDTPPELRQAGWEDVLWIVFMSPDFQFLQ